jgi:hypothetical protein
MIIDDHHCFFAPPQRPATCNDDHNAIGRDCCKKKKKTGVLALLRVDVTVDSKPSALPCPPLSAGAPAP